MGITFQQSICPTLALTSQGQLHPCSPPWFMATPPPDAPISNSNHSPRVSLPAYLQSQWILSNTCRITVVLTTVSTSLPVPHLPHVIQQSFSVTQGQWVPPLRTSRSSLFIQRQSIIAEDSLNVPLWPAGAWSRDSRVTCLYSSSASWPSQVPCPCRTKPAAPSPPAPPTLLSCYSLLIVFIQCPLPLVQHELHKHGDVSFISPCVPKAVMGT